MTTYSHTLTLNTPKLRARFRKLLADHGLEKLPIRNSKVVLNDTNRIFFSRALTQEVLRLTKDPFLSDQNFLWYRVNIHVEDIKLQDVQLGLLVDAYFAKTSVQTSGSYQNEDGTTTIWIG